MPNCIECSPKRIFQTTKALWIHLQKQHKWTALSTFRCGENGCQRKFSSGKAFLRHVKTHKDLNDIAVQGDINVDPDLAQTECDTSITENIDLAVSAEDNALSVNDESFQNALKCQADAFICKYYSKPTLPRNLVQNIVDDIQDFLFDGMFMNLLHDKVMDALQSSQAEQTLIGEISSMFETLQNPFSHLKTEYHRVKYFENSGYYVKPQTFQLGKRLQQVKTKQGMRWKWVPVTAVHVPLTPVLKNFLQLPNALQSILDYMKDLQDENDFLSNFIQGDIWKGKLEKFSATDIVIPLFVYFDDFQGNNVLGSHSLKIGGIYVVIGCLPPEIASRIENIFLSILFNSSDRSEFKSKNILKPLLEELICLEKEGIDVELFPCSSVKVYFVLGLVLGDNLGIHQLCGFVCGFSWANFPCRFCKISQQQMQYDITLDRSLLRSRTNYENDIVINDQTKTGVSEECAFNTLDSFHIIENLEGDLLHDFDEGICHYVLTCVLSNLTTAKPGTEKPVFTLATLNRRMQLFNFGTHSSLYKTKLGVIAEDLVKRKLKMTGSEMEWFVRSFGILVGDLVPFENKYWKLYLALLNVLDIVRAKTLPKSSLISLPYYLKVLAQYYLDHGDHLVFKFHKILWHYQCIISKSGPVVNLSVRKFESKHRQLKLGLYSNMSRVNACLSAAIKHQLGLCHRFIAKRSVLPDIDMGSGSILSAVTFTDYQKFKGNLEAIFPNLSNVFVPNWVDYKGCLYDSNSTLVIDVNENLGWPIFGELKCIFVSDKKVAFLCQKLETVGFSDHLHAYEVIRTKERICLDIDSLFDYAPLNTLTAPKGGLYVILRYQI